MKALVSAAPRAYRAALWTGSVAITACMAAGFVQSARDTHGLPGLSRDPFVGALAALAHGDRAAAGREYRVGAAVNSFDYSLQISAAEGLAASRDLAGAEQALARAEWLRPNLAATSAVRGWVLHGLGHEADAFGAFAEALGRDSGNVRALAGLGEVLLTRGQDADAARVLGRAVVGDPRRASLRDALGVALAGAERPGEAAEQFAVALAMEPSPQRQANLARARAAAGVRTAPP